jgi:radical SAM-linked protein
MSQTHPERYRITYGKGSAMRFTGHLDLQRTWERTFRRAGLPLAYSQGYNPRPKLQLSPALPLGCTSECEMIDIWLKITLEPEEIHDRIVEALPAGLTISGVSEIPASDPALQNQVTSVEYHVSLPELQDLDLQQAIEALLTAREIQRIRRGKGYDLRSLVETLELIPQEAGALVMTLASREGATGRPEEVLLELGLDPADCLIHRSRLLVANPESA